MHLPLRVPLFFALLALCGLSTMGCTPIVRDRTLPPSIRSVVVPMAYNRTSEPGFEERLTVAVQEEFDADGRLTRARSVRDADAIIRLYITDWETSAFALDGDGFPMAQEHAVRVHIHIQENIPGRPMIGQARVVDENFIIGVDTRSTTFIPEPRRKEELARRLARNIVREVITGEFEGVEAKSTPRRSPVTTSRSNP